MVFAKDIFWRFGNQFFVLAAGIALAARNNDKFWFPEWSYAPLFRGDFTNPEVIPEIGRVFQEQGFHYTPIPYEKGITISGYFQSHKYFEDQRQLICDMFTPKNIKTFNDEDSCSIHVRLGDYKKHPNFHPIKTWDNYYEKAIDKYFQLHNHKSTIFRVFSDDLDDAKKIFPKDKYKFDFVDCPHEIMAYSLMSSCRDNIIGNSSFSWVAAWVNPNPSKIVIAPKEWFGNGYAHYDLKDLFPQEWHQV